MIFHLAAQLDVRVSVAQPVFDAEVNVIGSLNVCEGALAAGTQQGRVRGFGRHALRRRPKQLPDAREPPAAARCRRTASSKKAVGDYLHYYREVRGLEYTVLALANVYGPRQDPHGEAGVVAIFAGQHARRASSRRSSATARRRATSCSSTTSSTRSCAPTEKGGGLLMNIGTGVETSVQQLYDAMARLTGYPEPPNRAPDARRASCRGRRSTPAAPPSTWAGSPGRGSTRASAHRRLVPRPRRLTERGVGAGAEQRVEVVAEAEREGDERERRRVGAARREDGAAPDVEVGDAVHLQVGVDHARRRVVAHPCGAHVVGARVDHEVELGVVGRNEVVEPFDVEAEAAVAA